MRLIINPPPTYAKQREKPRKEPFLLCTDVNRSVTGPTGTKVVRERAIRRSSVCDHNTTNFTSCVLLLLTLSWRTSIGHPVRTLSPEMCANCSSLYRSLLTSIAQLRESKELCYGIASERVVVGSRADTVLACAPSLPQNSSCMMQRNSPFSESECLRNIMKDLAYYAAAFESYLKTPLQNPVNTTAVLKPVQDTIQSLRENCSLMPNGENDSSEVNDAKIWGNDSFSNRLEMCNMLRGFYVRTITINRAMGYISSGDYKK